MDKKLIERIAMETAQEAEVLDADGECPKREGVDITEYVLDFAHRFLARIDAERGKKAVARIRYHAKSGIQHFNEGDCYVEWAALVVAQDGDGLFLSPTIPEGMALAPAEPTQAMSEAALNTFIRTSAHETEIDVDVIYHAMLAAAQGERNA